VVAEGVVVVALERVVESAARVVESAAEMVEMERAEMVVVESVERSAFLLQARVKAGLALAEGVAVVDRFPRVVVVASSALLLTTWVVAAAVSSALMAESTASNWCSQKNRTPPFTFQLPWSHLQLARGKMCRYSHLLGHTLLEYALLLLQHAQGALYAPVCVLPCKQQTNVCMIQRPTRLAHQNHLRSACPPMV
jgi:hypothetical protein